MHNKTLMEFYDWVEQTGFNGIETCELTWAQIGNMFGVHKDTVRKWWRKYKKYGRMAGEKKGINSGTVPLKKWEMYTKNGIVELHSYKYDINLEEVVNEATKEIVEIIKNLEVEKRGKSSGTQGLRSVKGGKRESIGLLLGDVHIGMEIKNSLFGYEWDRNILMKRREMMVQAVIDKANREGIREEVVVVFGGDLVDGLDGQTTRKRHELPQNMSNKDQLVTAFDFILNTVNDLTSHFDRVAVHIITNSNHGGILEYAAAKMVKEVSDLKYDNVDIHVHEDFMTKIDFCGVNAIITHGYDEEIMTRGMGRFMNKANMDMVSNFNDIYMVERKCEMLLRFDQHQYHDILYENIRDVLIPAFAPPSSYISYNFGAKFPGGFVIFCDDTFKLVKFS